VSTIKDSFCNFRPSQYLLFPLAVINISSNPFLLLCPPYRVHYRPLGSKHPKHGFIYPVNYGFIPGTVSGDGEELDAYVLGEHKPLETFTGKVVAIIHRTNDNDDKLVVMADGRNYTDEQIRALTEFQEQYFESVIYR